MRRRRKRERKEEEEDSDDDDDDFSLLFCDNVNLPPFCISLAFDTVDHSVTSKTTNFPSSLWILS